MSRSPELHLWDIDLADPGWDAGADTLDAAEAARFARIVVASAATHQRRARIALRHLLGRHIDARPRDLAFAYGAHGKPALDGRRHGASPPEFNLSHSGDRAILAIAAAPVGVDIERGDRDLPDLDRLLDMTCAAAERAGLAGLAPARRRAAFFRLWTRKEAYCKAIGLGLAQPMHRFALAETPAGSIVTDADAPAPLPQERDLPAPPHRCGGLHQLPRHVVDLPVAPGWFAAVCSPHAAPALRRRQAHPPVGGV